MLTCTSYPLVSDLEFSITSCAGKHFLPECLGLSIPGQSYSGWREAPNLIVRCMQGGVAPAPAPMAGPPALPKASDALALTNSTLNQLQV